MSCAIVVRCVLVLAISTTSGLSTSADTATTAGTSPARTPPLSPENAAEYLNKQYMGLQYTIDFSKKLSLHLKPETPLGVTISWAAQHDDFNKNLYCQPYTKTGCHMGFADCRMSASLFNWKMLNVNHTWATVFGRAVGYVFNQSMVEQTWGKCSYMFDGASENRLNGGCGTGAGSNCSAPGSAYAGICPSTGKICTAEDGEVKGSLCRPVGPVPVPVAGNKGYQCFFSGPALNYPKQDQPSHLREMVKQRLNKELSTQDYQTHNEVILDERLLIPALSHDPALAIPAFVYSLAQADRGSRAQAEAMRDKFCHEYGVSKIPVIGVNDVSDFRPNGPFFVPQDPSPPTPAPLTLAPPTPAPPTPSPPPPKPPTPTPTPAPPTSAPPTPAPWTPVFPTPAPLTPVPPTPASPTLAPTIAPATPAPPTHAPPAPAPPTLAPPTPAPPAPAPPTPAPPKPFPRSALRGSGQAEGNPSLIVI